MEAPLPDAFSSPVDGIPSRVFYWALRGLIAASIANLVIHVFNWIHAGASPPFADFFGLWSFGRYAITHGAGVYDPRALAIFEHAIAPPFPGFYPCPYPPIALLYFALAGLLPLAAGYGLWMVITFLAYAVATLGARWRSLAGLALVAAPTTVVTMLDGQNGFLSGALIVGGLRYATDRPILSGVLFGLLTYKPQLGVLVPIALIAAGRWRVISVAAATSVSLILLSILVFGWDAWVAWPQSLPHFTHLIEQRFAHDAVFMPTIVAGLRQLGAPKWLANAAQYASLIIIAGVVWRMCRHGLTERAIAVIPIATILATPYAFTYDLPMVAAGLMLEALRRQRLGVPTTVIEVALLFIGTAVLFAMTSYAFPLALPVLMALMVWRIAAAPA